MYVHAACLSVLSCAADFKPNGQILTRLDNALEMYNILRDHGFHLPKNFRHKVK